MSRAPEAKVVAATTGAGLGAVVAGFLVWLLDEYAFRAGGVPVEVSTLVLAAVPVTLTYAAGWLAPHTHRPDLARHVVAELDVTGEPRAPGVRLDPPSTRDVHE